jgi:hypothetical protein
VAKLVDNQFLFIKKSGGSAVKKLSLKIMTPKLPECVGGPAGVRVQFAFLTEYLQARRAIFFDWPSLIAAQQRLCAVSHPKRP